MLIYTDPIMSYSLGGQMKKSKSFSKYLYSSVDNEEDFYLFDIKLISNKKKSKKIRKIKNSKSDVLISLGDNVNVNKYITMELEITNITKPNINHNLLIDLKSNSSIYQDSFIYLELTNEMNLLKCFYNLEQL